MFDYVYLRSNLFGRTAIWYHGSAAAAGWW